MFTFRDNASNRAVCVHSDEALALVITLENRIVDTIQLELYLSFSFFQLFAFLRVS